MSVLDRVEALAALADEHAPGLPTPETLCARLGISRATAYRYRAALAAASNRRRPRSRMARLLRLLRSSDKDSPPNLTRIKAGCGVSRATAYRYAARLKRFRVADAAH